MKICKEAYHLLVSAEYSRHVEVGGILGGVDHEIITHIAFDKQNTNRLSRILYVPNIVYLNTVIRSWYDNNIQFLGMFHSHTSGDGWLSEEDKIYIRRIMYSSSAKTLYFPILLPTSELICYKAIDKKNGLVIEQTSVKLL